MLSFRFYSVCSGAANAAHRPMASVFLYSRVYRVLQSRNWAGHVCCVVMQLCAFVFFSSRFNFVLRSSLVVAFHVSLFSASSYSILKALPYFARVTLFLHIFTCQCCLSTCCCWPGAEVFPRFRVCSVGWLCRIHGCRVANNFKVVCRCHDGVMTSVVACKQPPLHVCFYLRHCFILRSLPCFLRHRVAASKLFSASLRIMSVEAYFMCHRVAASKLFSASLRIMSVEAYFLCHRVAASKLIFCVTA